MISISGNLHFKIPWYFLVFHVRKNPVLMFCLTTSVDTIYHTINPYKFNIISYSKGSWKKLKRLPFSKLYQLMLYLFCPSSVHPSLSLSLWPGRQAQTVLMLALLTDVTHAHTHSGLFKLWAASSSCFFHFLWIRSLCLERSNHEDCWKVCFNRICF